MVSKRRKHMKRVLPQFICEKNRQGIFCGKFRASALFLDISGFTAMTERLMSHGKEGAEVLSLIINDVFEPVINTVYASDGFISTFAGDAFSALFPGEDVHKVLACGATIRERFQTIGRQHTKFGVFDLFAKQGISRGSVEWEITGTAKNKTYYFRGDAIDNSATCEHHCQQMDIVLDETLIKQIEPDTLKTEPLNDKYHQLIHLVKTESTAEKELPEETSINEETLAKFVPETIINFHQQGEFREIVSLFISFQEPQNPQSLKELIRQTLTIVNQQGVYFNKMDFGDKGGVILALFGAPLSYENNLIRALNAITQLQRQFKDTIRAGITMGIAYCGLVGSKRRCEYTALGDIVNQSARMMMQAPWGEVWINETISKQITRHYLVED